MPFYSILLPNLMMNHYWTLLEYYFRISCFVLLITSSQHVTSVIIMIITGHFPDAFLKTRHNMLAAFRKCIKEIYLIKICNNIKLARFVIGKSTLTFYYYPTTFKMLTSIHFFVICSRIIPGTDTKLTGLVLILPLSDYRTGTCSVPAIWHFH